MKMSVTPQEIAEHLVKELGYQQALDASKRHLERCYDPETAGVWTNIGQALQNINPTDKRI